MSSLTCNAVLGCVTQSRPSCWWRGLGQRLTTAKESSRSERERERESVWEKKWVRESVNVQRCPVLQDYSSVFLLFVFFLSSRTPLFSSPLCLHLPPIISAFRLSTLIAFAFSTFHFPSLSLLSFSHPSFFYHCEWSECFSNTCTLSSPVLPCITSHGYPCILQVRALCVCVRERDWVWEQAWHSCRLLWVMSRCLECSKSPWSILISVHVLIWGHRTVLVCCSGEKNLSTRSQNAQSSFVFWF